MTRSRSILGLLCIALSGCGSSSADTFEADAADDTTTAATDTGTAVTDTGTAAVDTGPAADTGPAVDTGMSTDTPMLMGKCTNAADTAALPKMHNGKTIETHLEECARSCIGSPAGMPRTKCVNDCVQAPARVNGAITSACTNCFSAQADCAIAKCLGDCIGGETPACVKCQCTNCSAAQTACSGLPDTRC